MTVQRMTEDMVNDASPVSGKLVVTYKGSPHPATLAYIDGVYLAANGVKGKKVPVTTPGGKKADKQHVMSRSIALVADLEDEDKLSELVVRLNRERGELVKAQEDLVKALCTDTPAPKARTRSRTASAKPSVRQRTRG